MKTKHFLILACTALFGITSCVKDTCNGALGNTFESSDFDSTYNNSDLLALSFSIETLEDMPEDYFLDVIPGDDNTLAQIQSIAVNKTNLELTLVDSILPAANSSVDLTFNFHFQDRRNYIDCQHSGSSDSYILELNFNLWSMEGDIYIFSGFTWNEIFAAGHL